jgi:hypothetical protein
MNLAEFLTPIGLAVLILVIFREGQRDQTAENLRRDEREANRERQRNQENRQWLMMFSALTGKQIEVKTTVEKAAHTSEMSQAQIIQSLEEFKGLFIMTIDMMMEDPRATYERIKRMQAAWAEGDMEKAQNVVDEAQAIKAMQEGKESKPL